RVMARTGSGQTYARQYYRFRPEIGRIILTHPRLLLRIREKVKQHVPFIEALVEGREGSLSRAELKEIDALLKSLEDVARPELRRVLAELRRDLLDPELLARHGIAIRETPGTIASAGSVREAYGKLPLRFEVDGANYVARGPGYNIHIKRTE